MLTSSNYKIFMVTKELALSSKISSMKIKKMSDHKPIVLTNVQEEQGKINRGKELLLTLPTGDEVNLQFVIASGTLPGLCY
jgi:hypothetical protein